MPRPRKLPPDRAAELRRRYAMYRDALRTNSPKVLCQDFGIDANTLRKYVQGLHRSASRG